MKEIVFATTNEAKIKQMRGALAPAGIKVTGVAKGRLPEVEENGTTASENARIKALAFARALATTVFAMDNALYIEGLAPEEQPGLHVRRIKGFVGRPSDKQLLAYMAQVIKGLGGKVNVYWEYGGCIATPTGKHLEITLKTPRIMVAKPSKNIMPGYPLESIQIDPESGKYIADLTQEEKDKFWQKQIGQELMEFILAAKL